MQHRIRQLRQMASKHDIDGCRLSDDEKLEFLAVKSQLFILSRELNLIFESLARAQARQTDMEGNDVFAAGFDTISSNLLWNALDEPSDQHRAVRIATFNSTSEADGLAELVHSVRSKTLIFRLSLLSWKPSLHM